MSRRVRHPGWRVTYRRNYFPNGNPDRGQVRSLLMNAQGRAYRWRICAVCGGRISLSEARFVDRNGQTDHVHLGCAEDERWETP